MTLRRATLLTARSGWITLVFVTACMFAASQAPQSTPTAAPPTPEPAIPAILAAFDRYDVVAINAAHGHKDLDDFILTLIRDPHFPDKVNDIEVECGNSLYQSVLDRYIAGIDVPFADVRKVWRNTTQSMCGMSGFYEQLFPLVRVINQKLPAAKRLRVLAGDPPIDWEKVTTRDEAMSFLSRDPSIASVMTKEVLSRHRKALMLFGTFHLMHGIKLGAVSAYEKEYPNRTFVIDDLGSYDASHRLLSVRPFTSWPTPSLARTQGTSLGALSLSDVAPPTVLTNNCKVTIGFPPDLERPMAALVDAFVYLGPPEFTMNEPMPGSIALDAEYASELLRREALIGPPGAPSESLKDFQDEIMQQSQTPIRSVPELPDVKAIERSCLEQQKQGGGPHPL